MWLCGNVDLKPTWNHTLDNLGTHIYSTLQDERRFNIGTYSGESTRCDMWLVSYIYIDFVSSHAHDVIQHGYRSRQVMRDGIDNWIFHIRTGETSESPTPPSNDSPLAPWNRNINHCLTALSDHTILIGTGRDGELSEEQSYLITPSLCNKCHKHPTFNWY